MPIWYKIALLRVHRPAKTGARLPLAALLLLAMAPAAALADDADGGSAASLGTMSIEDLASIEVSSVSKSAEPLSDAAASIYVITHDDIMRSGATSLPEILRLAPNLEVAQYSANTFAITARGMNGTLADKLLVLIDGRSVYSPLYAGVYWDTQMVVPEDIDRIEVISGPGGTLWGANAVNGVINIITRKSSDTQGGYATAAGGNLNGDGVLQYGGKLGADATYRLYGSGSFERDGELSSGMKAIDGWHRYQEGFRVDWNRSQDLVTIEGDIYQQREEQAGTQDSWLSGKDLVARWNHTLDGGSELQVQAYYDDTRRFTDDGGGGFLVDTYDVEAQHSFSPNSWNHVVWGAGDRIEEYQTTNIPALQILPSSDMFNLGNVFVQDTIDVSSTVKLIPGVKVEWDPYVGAQELPSIRTSWKVTPDQLLWAAVSRAVRAPTPYDRDLNLYLGPIHFLTGGPEFQSEKLIAYEIGYRAQPLPRLSFSMTGFDDVYNELRSIEVNPHGGVFPLQWGNLMEGSIYGVEAWGTYSVTDWWRLSAGFNVQHEQLKFQMQSSQLGGILKAGDDPNHQESLRSADGTCRTT